MCLTSESTNKSTKKETKQRNDVFNASRHPLIMNNTNY